MPPPDPPEDVPLDDIWPQRRTPVQSLALNMLKRRGIRTLSQLEDLDDDGLRDIHNLGAGSRAAIRDILASPRRPRPPGASEPAPPEARPASVPGDLLVTLSDSDRAILERWAQGSNRLASRATAILALAEGWYTADIADALGVDFQSVKRWLGAFSTAGPDGLREKGEHGSLSAGERHTLQELAAGTGPLRLRALAVLAGDDGVTTHAAARELGVSPATISVWRRNYQTSGPEGLITRTPGRTAAWTPIAVAPEDRLMLGRWAREPGRQAMRAAAILALADGADPADVAGYLDVSLQSVRNWHQAFTEAGPDGIRGKRPPGRQFGIEAPARHSRGPSVSDADRAVLERWTRSGRLGLRARIILACANPAATVDQVAADLGTTSGTVARWCRQYAESGLDGLLPPD